MNEIEFCVKLSRADFHLGPSLATDDPIDGFVPSSPEPSLAQSWPSLAHDTFYIWASMAQR